MLSETVVIGCAKLVQTRWYYSTKLTAAISMFMTRNRDQVRNTPLLWLDIRGWVIDEARM